MTDLANPLLPAGYDIAWSAALVAVIGLAVVALISLAGTARHLTSRQALVWVLLVLFVPALGPVAWLAIGRRAAREPHAAPR